jgi:hypothetical protein
MAGVVVLGEADAGGSGGCCPLWATYRNTTIMDRKLIDLRLGPSISLMITSVTGRTAAYCIEFVWKSRRDGPPSKGYGKPALRSASVNISMRSGVVMFPEARPLTVKPGWTSRTTAAAIFASSMRLRQINAAVCK